MVLTSPSTKLLVESSLGQLLERVEREHLRQLLERVEREHLRQLLERAERVEREHLSLTFLL